MAHRPRRKRTQVPLVVARLRHTQHPAGQSHRQPLGSPSRGTAVNGQLSLQLGDPPARGDQLSRIAAGDARYLPGIDEVLTAPVPDRLVAYAEELGHLGDRPRQGPGSSCGTRQRRNAVQIPPMVLKQQLSSIPTVPNPGHVEIVGIMQGATARAAQARAGKRRRTVAELDRWSMGSAHLYRNRRSQH